MKYQSEPTDAQPEEYDIALAAAKTEHYTPLAVRRISHSWAGLRTFTHDLIPVAGFAPDTEGFFWLAGQGGICLQTARDGRCNGVADHWRQLARQPVGLGRQSG